MASEKAYDPGSNPGSLTPFLLGKEKLYQKKTASREKLYQKKTASREKLYQKKTGIRRFKSSWGLSLAWLGSYLGEALFFLLEKERKALVEKKENTRFPTWYWRGFKSSRPQRGSKNPCIGGLDADDHAYVVAFQILQAPIMRWWFG